MITKWIEQAASTAGIPVSRIAAEEVDRIVGEIYSRFTREKSNGCLWESFVDDVSCRLPDAWREIRDFDATVPILLFKEHARFAGFLLSSCNELPIVLSETPGFEFYITNQEMDFVLCHNHHDYLVGVGSCTTCVQDLCRRKACR